MAYNIDQLEKAFGVNQGHSQNTQSEEDDVSIDGKYISNMHTQFSKQLQKVSEELQELESKISVKRNEFFKLQGAYEIISGLKRDIDNAKK